MCYEILAKEKYVPTEMTMWQEVLAKGYQETGKAETMDERVDLENLYHIDETILLWKCLPTGTLEGEGKENLSGCKSNNEKIVLCLCANTSGDHRIKPLVVDNYKKTGDLKNQMYDSHLTDEQEMIAQKNADSFADWYENDFKPSCSRHQLENGLTGKICLLLEYCNRINVTDSESEKFEIHCLSASSPFLKRMNQDVIEIMKTYYRYRLMKEFLRYPNEDDFYQNYSIKDCVNMVMESWTDAMDGKTNAEKKPSEPVDGTKKIREKIKDSGPGSGTILIEMRDMMTTITKRSTTIEDVINFLMGCYTEEQNIGSENEAESRGEIKENVVEENREESDDECLVIDESVDEDRDEINEDGNEEDQPNEEEPRKTGIELDSEEREEMEYIFKRLEYYYPRMPRETVLDFQGCKSTCLGEPKP